MSDSGDVSDRTVPDGRTRAGSSDSSAQFSADLRSKLSAFSVRASATRSGWSRSHVAEILSGKRLPSTQQLSDLLGVVDTSGEELAHWHERLARLTPSAKRQLSAGDPDQPNGGQAAPAKKWPKRLGYLAVGLILLAAGFASGFAVGRSTVREPVVTAGSAATIAHTEGLGVTTYRGPDRASGMVSAISEGSSVQIICQVGNGEPISDKVDGQVLTWPVWDRLGDGTWVPDIYTSTPKDYRPGPQRTVLRTC